MQCKELEAVLEQEGFSPLPIDAREHLAGCAACQGLVADLTTIVATAHQLPAEVAPPERLWVSLRAQLQAEGVIKEQELVTLPSPAPWWQHLSSLFRPRILATAAIGAALALGVYFQAHKSATPVATAVAPVAEIAPASPVSSASAENVATPAVQQPHRPAHSQAAASAPDIPLRPSPSELAGTTLTNVEQDISPMQLAGNSAADLSLRQNLHTLNEFISECQQRLKHNPQDELAREYLYSAYQQKAELLSAMMESGRSEH